MNADIRLLFDLILRTFVDPRGVAQQLTSRRYDRGTLWSMCLLVIVLSVLFIALGSALFPSVPQAGIPVVTPMSLGVILGSVLIILVFCIYFTGRALGGTGHFQETLLLMIWHQAVSIALQALQIIVMFIAPVLGGMVSVIGLGFMIFILLHFINVLHGFDSLAKALATLLVALLGMAIGLSIILTLIGVSFTMVA